MAATAKSLHDEGAAATEWTAAGRRALLAEGFTGIDGQIDEGLKATRSSAKRQSLQSLRSYPQPHARHLDYATRLAEGRSIGSGQIEGACKNCIGRRLKQTGARWRPRRINRMAGLCTIMYSNQWNPYWESLNT